MAEFTKDQLINLARENVRVLKQATMQHKVQPVIAMDLRLAEIALAALTDEPALYCMEGDTLDEENVSISKAVVDAWVEEWNGEGRCPGEPVYKTVALYRLPEIE